MTSTQVHPYWLVDNIKVENYKSVSFYKHNDGIKCIIVYEESYKDIEFHYVFDSNDCLLSLYSIDDKETKLLFDRDYEINIETGNYIMDMMDSNKVCKRAM
ncbi:hypothetical protein IMX26_08745 [Clostridium sp. 'deep sea']|uniref:hypothetical protein n=1 Tax=Clostridium sp. 'deep sea' TaxID=2779445 RepID=UPI0018969FFC|nr:hypothetical protein [Clostridium sp. 'deep sea']QOR36878.1 hypothetical protein IMX26_08745 [Clostridium sp. 'deep sea']